MYKKTTPKNGLRIITVPDKGASSVSVLIMVATGSKYETKEQNGLSHFLEHLFFKGTQKRPNTLKISEELDKIGGQYNAFTSKEYTGFWAKVDKKHTDVALDWIFDIFLNSKFDAAEMEREKGVVIEELNMYLDTPTSYVLELFEELLYGDQPAGWNIVGTRESITAFTREQLLDYYENHYALANVVVCVAGDINVAQVIKKIEAYAAEPSQRRAQPKLATLQQQTKPGFLLKHKKTDQTHICLGVRAYDMFDRRRWALQLIATMLGGNMSSRLFISVRERNSLAYYVHTSVDMTTDTGYLVTQAGVKNDGVQKAVQLILAEYKNIAEQRVSAEELQKAKDYIRGSMALSLESTDSKASFFTMQEIMGQTIMTPEERLKLIDVVTVEDIQSTARDIFKNDKLNLSVIAPMEEQNTQELENLLAL